MKRLLCLLLSLLLVMSMLAACGKSDTSDNDSDTKKSKSHKEEEEETTAPPKEEMDLPDLAEYVQNRTVTITVNTADGVSAGSGFFIDAEGTLVTCYHVIDAAKSISVEVVGGAKYDVNQIIDFDEMHDIAILKLDITGNDYLDICAEGVRTGESAYAVGSSLGFLDGTFSNGIISNTARQVGGIDCLQTTAAISSGNSGGPLVNVYGEVVGVNAFSYTSGENLNFAVKISIIDALAKDKDWDMSAYAEWYQKEIGRSYYIWSYSQDTWSASKVYTYQEVTGRECYVSDYGWDLSKYAETGYREKYGVYYYEYNSTEFDQYTTYLKEQGFVYKDGESGIYLYENEFTGIKVRMMVLSNTYVGVEAYKD